MGVAAGDALVPRPGPLAPRGEALLEALGGEVVHHGVQAAVEAGHAQRDWVERPGEALHAAAGQRLGAHQGVEEEDGVVGHEADDEDAQVDQDHAQDAPFAVGAVACGRGLAERLKHQGGAHQVGQQGEQESKDLVPRCKQMST